MHNPIQTMLDEHAIISSTQPIILQMNEMWEQDADAFTEKTKKLVEFFREYADGYHHRKEEDVLFPAIKNHPDFILDEMIDEFEQHHEEFREYARDIKDHLDQKEYSDAYKQLRNYLEDLLDHIAAENDELFIMAENLLDDDSLETIYFRFKDIDLELGEDRKTELERMISSL